MARSTFTHRELGIGIVAYSPLGHGFFGGKAVVESLPSESLLVCELYTENQFQLYASVPEFVYCTKWKRKKEKTNIKCIILTMEIGILTFRISCFAGFTSKVHPREFREEQSHIFPTREPGCEACLQSSPVSFGMASPSGKRYYPNIWYIYITRLLLFFFFTSFFLGAFVFTLFFIVLCKIKCSFILWLHLLLFLLRK